MDTSIPKEDGLLLPQELINQCLPGPMFKCQVLKLHDCRGDGQRRNYKTGKYTDDANCPLWKLFGGHLSFLFWGQLFRSTQFLTFWQLEIQVDASVQLSIGPILDSKETSWCYSFIMLTHYTPSTFQYDVISWNCQWPNAGQSD